MERNASPGSRRGFTSRLTLAIALPPISGRVCKEIESPCSFRIQKMTFVRVCVCSQEETCGDGDIHNITSCRFGLDQSVETEVLAAWKPPAITRMRRRR